VKGAMERNNFIFSRVFAGNLDRRFYSLGSSGNKKSFAEMRTRNFNQFLG